MTDGDPDAGGRRPDAGQGSSDSSFRSYRRTLILNALATLVRETGYGATSVSAVCAKARISRRAFYQEFSDLDDCLLALFEEGRVQTHRLIFQAFDGAADWREGVREALASLLLFFDANPNLAWVWLIESSTAGQAAFAFRERKLTALTRSIVDRWPPPPEADAHSLAPVSIIASVIAVLQKHLVRGRPEPLISLLGPLMGIVASPYLNPEQVQAEVEFADRRARETMDRPTDAKTVAPDHDGQVPGFLLDGRSHRARAVLFHLNDKPEGSNREIADAIGISSDTQIATLLARLDGMGLLTKQAGAAGKPNRWSLSSQGAVVLDTLRERDRRRTPPQGGDEAAGD